MSPIDPEATTDQTRVDAYSQQRTIGQLVADATQDVQGIVHSEIALAKAEVAHGARSLGKGAALLGVAAFLALLALIMLLHMLAHVLDLWLPIWAGYGIVAVVLLIITAIFALTGARSVKRGKGDVVPKRAIAEAEQNLAIFKS